MASLAQASVEFVEALRRGLSAYDAGDRAQAYDLFSQALDIEPDNVWALLWKGATAPTPNEAVLWLEQAQALETDNEHAIAGLAWAQRELSGGTSSAGVGTGGAMAPVAPPATPAMGDDFGMDAFPAEDEEVPDWLQSDQSSAFGGTSTATTTPAFEETADDDLSWLEEPSASTTTAAPAPVANEADDLPDWLRDAQGTATPTAEEDIPDWLRDDSAVAAAPDVDMEDLPDWLRGDDAGAATAAPAAVEAMPDWLSVTEEPIEIDTSRRPEGSLPASGPVTEAYQAGLLAYEENRLDDAVRAFERTIQLDNRHVEAHNYLGSVYFLQGRTTEAIRAFQSALQLQPDHSESHLNLGLVFQETGQNEQAIRMFERYLQLDPTSSIAGEVQGFISQLRG